MSFVDATKMSESTLGPPVPHLRSCLIVHSQLPQFSVVLICLIVLGIGGGTTKEKPLGRSKICDNTIITHEKWYA